MPDAVRPDIVFNFFLLLCRTVPRSASYDIHERGISHVLQNAASGAIWAACVHSLNLAAAGHSSGLRGGPVTASEVGNTRSASGIGATLTRQAGRHPDSVLAGPGRWAQWP